jgi:hypothetical protein
MVTATDRKQRTLGLPAIAAAALLASWLIVVATAVVVPAPGAVAVVGGPERTLAIIAAAEGRIVEPGALITIARSDDPGFVRRLYAGGALLVLPSRPGGCLGRNRVR